MLWKVSRLIEHIQMGWQRNNQVFNNLVKTWRGSSKEQNPELILDLKKEKDKKKTQEWDTYALVFVTENRQKET